MEASSHRLSCLAILEEPYQDKETKSQADIALKGGILKVQGVDRDGEDLSVDSLLMDTDREIVIYAERNFILLKRYLAIQSLIQETNLTLTRSNLGTDGVYYVDTPKEAYPSLIVKLQDRGEAGPHNEDKEK